MTMYLRGSVYTMREIRPGIWHWEAPHPAWNERQDWGRIVSSFAIDDGARLTLFDPLSVPDAIEELARARDTAIVLTCQWHSRDTRALAERLAATLHVPPPDEADPDPVRGNEVRPGDRLELGIRAFEGLEPIELLLWVESSRALVAGDALVDRGNGFEFPQDWADRAGSAEATRGRLRRELLPLPVELVLATHGGPFDRADLERALA